MKKIYSILAITGLISLCGCDKSSEIDFPFEGVRMSLRIEGSELVTKATEEGEDTFNENVIKTIHYYFFTESDSLCVYDGIQTINKTGGAEFSLSGISATDYGTIFSGGRTELLTLVVVNATTSAGTSTTKYSDVMKETMALSGFGKQDSFVMVGSGKLTKGANVGTVLTASTDDISLKRLSSKITLRLIIPESYEDGSSNVWIPQLGSIQVDFKNMGKNSLLSGKKAASPVVGDVTRKAKTSDSDLTVGDAYDTSTPPAKIGSDVSLAVPVYSYPRVWSNGDSDTPYIYVAVSWKQDGTTTTADTYYKILLPGISLDRNTWYDITAKLGGLGSLTKEGTVEIPDLAINVSKSWNDAIGEGYNNTDADVAMPRILAVEQNKYILYNQDEVVIPFVSSHDCEIVSLTVDQQSHPNTMGALQTPVAVVNNGSRTITFTHTLLNDQSSKPYDYLMFKAHFTIQHIGNPSYNEVIEIEQSPALCVESFNNANGYRNVFVNGTQEQATGTVYNSGKWAILRGSTSNTNVLQVTASVLTGGFSDYKIGDPRMRTNSMPNEPFVSATDPAFATDANGESLTDYYMAGSSTSDIIAPSFRISSSFGGTGGEDFSTNTYKYFQLRCAAYQEAGYPAGRWRLPTDAELKYCLQLQADGCLGNGIFNDSGSATPTYYISASGNFYGIKTVSGVKSIAGPATSGTNIRCVYDAWYWDNTTSPRLPESQYLYSECGTTNSNYKFIWGDQPISW